jgi:hypothetical protein
VNEEPTAEQLAKLPKWAWGHIKNLARQREEAVRKLEDFTEHKKDGNVEVTEISCHTTPPTIIKARFKSNDVSFIDHGIEVDVGTVPEGIRIRWANEGRYLSGDVPVFFDSPGGILLPNSSRVAGKR